MNISTATITSKGQISIPKQTREDGPFKEGDKVAVLAFGTHIEIRTLEEIEDRFFPMLASQEALAREWDTPEEDEAWKHLQKET